MINPTTRLVAVIAAIAPHAIACGDAAQPDISAPAIDAAPDLQQPDAMSVDAADSGPDTDTRTEPEPCCEVDPPPCCEPLLPPNETACGDGIDEDGDGDVDCDDIDCEDTLVCRTENPQFSCDECPAGTECVDERWCRYPDWVLPWPDYEVWSVVTALRLADAIPAGETYTEADVVDGGLGAICCFDVDGDDTVDNGLAHLAERFEGSVVDIRGALAGLVQSDSLTILARMVSGFDGTDPSQLHFYTGTNDLDGDGEPDQPWSDRQAGDGIFLRDGNSADPPAAPNQFNRGTYDALTGQFVSPAEPFVVTLPLDDLVAGLGDIALTVVDARLEALLDTAEPTTSLDREVDGEPLGGARFGGYIELDEVMMELDTVIRDRCDCARGTVTGEPPALSYGEGEGPRGDRYGISCNDEEFDVSACEAGDVICDNLSFVCTTVASPINSLPFADIDTNGNGIDDALSVGFFVSLANATIADFPQVEEGAGSDGSGDEGSGADDAGDGSGE